MQTVKWGKKQRVVRVPVGWSIIKNGKDVKEHDKFFNLATHSWDNVDLQEDVGLTVGVDFTDGVFIREDWRASSGDCEKDPRATRIVP